MQTKSDVLTNGGTALGDVAGKMITGRGVLEGLADLQEPPAYTPPTYSPGIQPTEAQIKADGEARAASNAQHEQFNDAFQAQEAQAAAWTQKLDDAYLEAIPPMKEIHGQPDPTEPPPPPPPGPAPAGTRTRPHGRRTTRPARPTTPGTW